MLEKSRTFYQLYQNDPNVIQGPVYLAYVLLVIVLFGSIGNVYIVLLTCKNSRLKNTCNYLLALLCLSDCLHQIGHLSYIYRMIVGDYFVTIRLCFLYQSIPIVGLLLGVLLPLLISCDRLCSCFFPQFHSGLNLVAYAGFICSICGFYVAFNFYMIIKHIQTTGDTLVLCVVPEPISFQKENNLIFQLTSVSINVTAVLVYVVVWTGLHCRKHVSEVTKRAFKALTAVIVALLVGWVGASISQLILIRFEAGPMHIFYSIAISGLCINVVCATNCVWLFAFSSDYRNAFRREFKRNTSKITSITYFK